MTALSPWSLPRPFPHCEPVEVVSSALVNPGGWEVTLCSDTKIMGSSLIIYSNAARTTSSISVSLWEVQEKLVAARDFCPRP